MKHLKYLTIVLMMMSANAVAEELTSVEDFMALPKYRALQISPDGRHLALIAPLDGTNHLVFLNIDDPGRPQQTGVLAPPKGEEVATVEWVSDKRVVVETSIIQGTLELPRLTGKILAVNYDGKKQAEIWSLEENRAFANVIDTIENDDDFVVVSHLGVNRSKPIIERLNVFTGRTNRIGISPLNNGRVLLDSDQNIRFAVGSDDDLNVLAAYRREPNGPWTTFDNPLGGEAFPVGITKDNKTVYLVSDGEDRMGVHKLDLETETITPIALHDKVEANELFWSRDKEVVIGVEFLPGLPEVRFVENDHEDRELWESLLATFEGMHVRMTSMTKDKSTAVVGTYSDRQPATWYLYNIPQGKLKYLVGAVPAIDPEAMAFTESRWITARDGVEFQLYVTLPPNAGKGSLPTIMYIHGGPHGPRDEWRYGPEKQLLASRGYAVVQPNYRGSGGFGNAFEKDAYRKWYMEMQDDITDATDWAIEHGIADKDKVCIYGASYGGYATLAGLTKEPDTYACGFAFVGVYDLELMHKVGDITERKSGRNFLDAAVGTDKQDLKARSPITHVAKIKAPLYIAHGKEDVRAHIKHFYALRDRLDEENIPYEELLVEKEGHGFYKFENRVHYANELLAFFDKHIGAGSNAGGSK